MSVIDTSLKPWLTYCLPDTPLVLRAAATFTLSVKTNVEIRMAIQCPTKRSPASRMARSVSCSLTPSHCSSCVGLSNGVTVSRKSSMACSRSRIAGVGSAVVVNNIRDTSRVLETIIPQESNFASRDCRRISCHFSECLEPLAAESCPGETFYASKA